MKKTCMLMIGLACIATAATAQKGKVSSATNYLMTKDYDGAKEAIDAALVNEKSANWPKTYIVASKVYATLAEQGKAEDGIEKSKEYLEKAIELDKTGEEGGKNAGKFAKEIQVSLLSYMPILENYAISSFNNKNYNRSLVGFETYLWASSKQTNYSEVNDTLSMYNAALAAYLSENYNKAEEYFGKAIQYNYGGSKTVIYRHEALTFVKDSAKIEDNLKSGFLKYPTDQSILTTLIQYYLTSSQNDAALEYLNKAVEMDGTNPSFYYARGVLKESINIDEAIVDYNKSLELDPKFFNSLFNLGAVYYNKGVAKTSEASGLRDNKEFDKAMAEAESWFKQSLPYLEKAYEVSPNDPKVLDSLKGLYYRFDMQDKYNEVVAKLKEL